MEGVSEELFKGLTSNPKYIPTWYKYDEEGSRLYDKRIEQSDAYYFPKYEVKLLKKILLTGSHDFSQYDVIVDLGCGNAAKTRMFFDVIVENRKLTTYVPVDISTDYLNQTSEAIKTEYGSGLKINPKPMDYIESLKQVRQEYSKERKLVIWFSGTMNLPYGEQVRYLSDASSQLLENDRLLITMDITGKDKQHLIDAAYFDSEGYQEEFQLNAIRRLNKEYQGDIDTANFEMKYQFVSEPSSSSCSFVKLWLEAQKDSTYTLEKLNLNLNFTKGERWYLHYAEGPLSCKYNMEQIRCLMDKASLEIDESWQNDHVAVVLLRTKHRRIE